MRLMWSGYQYRSWDGYGRYGAYMAKALLRTGVEVTPVLEEEINMPQWIQEMRGTRFDDRLTISCLPPYFLQKSPGRHWLLTMTEGSECPDGWADIINKSGVERVIVPCQHNAEAFARGGVTVPITVVPGGTDPDEFPLHTSGVLSRSFDSTSEVIQGNPRYSDSTSQPYTFLALADRGGRKGWNEVYTAFYLAFGGKTTGVQDVRLIVKCRPDGNNLLEMIAEAKDLDARLTIQIEDAADMREVYAQADCFVIPSHSEGWGMPHREAAMMGIPVITQAYAGLDDGHTHEWAIVVEKGHMERIPADTPHIKGESRVVDVEELAERMYQCYHSPAWAATRAKHAAKWLRANQTWDIAAQALLQVLQQEGALERERVFA